jgi:uncharacterized RDD family membrane protein YckC
METEEVQLPVKYATFWQRFGALIIDGIITSIPTFMFMGYAYFILKMDVQGLEYNKIAQPISFAIAIAYYSLFESGSKQGTWGKQILDLKVTDMTGDRISLNTAFTRTLTKLIPSIIGYTSLFVFGMIDKNNPDFKGPAFIIPNAMAGVMLIMYLIATITARRQAAHDLVAGTVVLKKYVAPEAW